MKTMKKTVLSVSAIVAMSNFVFAGGDIVEPVATVPMLEELSGFYAGLGIVAVSTRSSGFPVDLLHTQDEQDRLGNVSFFTGYNFNEYMAVEGRYTTSFTHDEEVEMNGWSLFVKPQYPVSEDLSVYALLGYGGVILEGKRPLGVVDVDDTAFQWGLGVQYMITENISLFADYTWLAYDMDGAYASANKVDVDAFTVGVNYFF